MYHPSNISETLEFQQRMAYSGSNLEYLGYAPPSADEGDEAWIIKKYTYDGSSNVVKVTFADDSKAFDKRWTNYSGYTYK